MNTKQHNFTLVNLDTDSISFCKPDGTPFSAEEAEELLNEINKQIPDKIQFEDDGIFSRVVVLKAKNYVLLKKNKKTGKDEISLKGSSLKDTKKEPALKEFMVKVIDGLLYEKNNTLQIYEDYCNEARNITDINRWAAKKTISKNLLKSTRKNETNVTDALGDLTKYREGDKVYIYNANSKFVQMTDEETGELLFFKSGKNKGLPKLEEQKVLKMTKDWDNDCNTEHYLGRVYSTLEIFEEVLDIKQFTCYSV